MWLWILGFVRLIVWLWRWMIFFVLLISWLMVVPLGRIVWLGLVMNHFVMMLRLAMRAVQVIGLLMIRLRRVMRLGLTIMRLSGLVLTKVLVAARWLLGCRMMLVVVMLGRFQHRLRQRRRRRRHYRRRAGRQRYHSCWKGIDCGQRIDGSVVLVDVIDENVLQVHRVVLRVVVQAGQLVGAHLLGQS